MYNTKHILSSSLSNRHLKSQKCLYKETMKKFKPITSQSNINKLFLHFSDKIVLQTETYAGSVI